jgi:uncharacterized NAD(P)/FAD-binding protein YdhS
VTQSVDILIVGCGAVGVSLLANFQRIAAGRPGTSIAVVDPAAEPGRGLAYGPDLDSNILNRANQSISVLADDQSEFFRWLAGEKAAGRLPARYAGLSLDPDGFAPRPLFGDYLAARARQAVAALRDRGWSIRHERSEACDIESDGRGYRVRCDNGRVWRAGTVILATGNGPSVAHRAFEAISGYVAMPYPTADLVPRIGADTPVALLGSRLTAVDAAIALVEQGHRAPIAMISRSGRLPMVGGGRDGHRLAADTVAAALAARAKGSGSLSLFRVMRILLREIARAEGRPVRAAEILRPDLDPIDFFLKTVADAGAGVRRRWQEALIPFNEFVADFWNGLDGDDQRRLMAGPYGAYMALRVAIPLTNGRKIADLLASGRVVLRWPLRSVRHDGHLFHLDLGGGEAKTGETLAVPALVNCTGVVGGPDIGGSHLYANLLRSGLVRRHPFGGLDVDRHSNRISNDHGLEEGLFAIGNATSGVFLLTSNLVLNAGHAERVAGTVLARLGQDDACGAGAPVGAPPGGPAFIGTNSCRRKGMS